MGGAVAGLAGGLAILVFMVAHAAIGGMDIWPSMKGPALPFYGTRVFEPGFDLAQVWMGLTTHFAVSVGWGVVFAVLAFGLSHVSTLAAGLAWGLIVWFGMQWVVLPLFGWAAVAHGTPTNLSLFEHVLFGLSMAVAFLPFQRPYAIVRSPALT